MYPYCPHCETPYLRVSTNGKSTHVRVTHSPSCPISDVQDRALRVAVQRDDQPAFERAVSQS